MVEVLTVEKIKKVTDKKTRVRIRRVEKEVLTGGMTTSIVQNGIKKLQNGEFHEAAKEFMQALKSQMNELETCVWERGTLERSNSPKALREALKDEIETCNRILEVLKPLESACRKIGDPESVGIVLDMAKYVKENTAELKNKLAKLQKKSEKLSEEYSPQTS